MEAVKTGSTFLAEHRREPRSHSGHRARGGCGQCVVAVCCRFFGSEGNVMRSILLAFVVSSVGTQVLAQEVLRCEQVRRAIQKESAIVREAQSRFSEHKAKGESWGFKYWTKVSEESVTRLQPLLAEGRQLTCLDHVDFDQVEANAATALRSMW